MENSKDLCNTLGNGDGRKAMAFTSYTPTTCGSGYQLFGHQGSVHNCLGRGQSEERIKKSHKKKLMG